MGSSTRPKGRPGSCTRASGLLRKVFWALRFFSMLPMGIEPWSQTPKSLVIAFTPCRHTSCVFCAFNLILLIRIATLLHVVRYKDSWTRPNGHQESTNGVSGHLWKNFWFIFSMLLVGIEPWSLSPKSLVLTFTLWRHTCKVVREKLILISIICIQANLHKWTGSSPRRGGQTRVRSFIGTWLKSVKMCHLNAIWNKFNIHLCA